MSKYEQKRTVSFLTLCALKFISVCFGCHFQSITRLLKPISQGENYTIIWLYYYQWVLLITILLSDKQTWTPVAKSTNNVWTLPE